MRRIGFWHQPSFWWKSPPSFLAYLLCPLGWLVGVWTMSRSFFSSPSRSSLPVICVGSFSVGGTGKTPLAQAIARALIEKGARPAFITRGYGGELAGPVQVDLNSHHAAHVGDEALLLAQTALTIVSRDRFAGAQYAEELGANIVILDDGLYNPSLYHDLRLAVIDGRLGLGNQCITPAGPLRAPLCAYASRVHGVCIIHPMTSAVDSIISWARTHHTPIFEMSIVPSPSHADALKERSVLAFTGIGHPQKFFDTLKRCGAHCTESYAYGDHHPFSLQDILFLAERVQSAGLIPVTTEKDDVRLGCLKRHALFSPEHSIIHQFFSRLQVLPIQAQWADLSARDQLLSRVYPERETHFCHTAQTTTY